MPDRGFPDVLPARNENLNQRDLLNGASLGVWAQCRARPHLLSCWSAPAQDVWTGFGAIGDYSGSNGNSLAVLEAAHRQRDGAYTSPPASTIETDEVYHLVVVGGGTPGRTTVPVPVNVNVNVNVNVR